MHVYHIKGLSGLLLFVLGAIALLLVLVGLPSACMMVFWNALVFEGFRGPEIQLYQGALLWVATLLLLKWLVNPEITFQFKQMNDPTELEKHLEAHRREMQDSSGRHRPEE